MKNYVLALVATALVCGCGIERVTTETRDQVIESNLKQGELLSKVRLQALDQTCGRLVYPDPRLDSGSEFDRLAVLMPYARECGKEASTNDLIELTYLLLRTVGVPGENPASTKTRYFALGALAAFIPDAKFEAILHDQIDLQGRYYSEAHQLAAIRYHFIQEYRLKPIFDETGKPDELLRFTVKQLEEAVAFYAQLTVIAKSPHRDRFILIVGDHSIALDLHPRPVPGGESHDWLADYSDLGERIRERFIEGSIPADRESPKARTLLEKLK